MAQPVVGEMEMHSVANLATLQTPLVTFFPLKKVAKPYLVSGNHRYCRASARSCFPARAHTSLSLSLFICLLSFCSARTHTSLSRSVCLLSFGSARSREEQSLIQLNTDIMLIASLIFTCKYITAQLLSLSYGYFI